MYVLGVDLGTTYSAAAVASGGRIEICQLGTRMAAIPSVVLLRADGSVVVGEAAERRALTEAGRSAREFKRRLGDPTPIILGGTPYGAEALTAHLLRGIIGQVTEERGEPPERIVVTHPAGYGPYKMEALNEAVRHAEAGPVRFVAEPVAAAIHYSEGERLSPGDRVAVYDFGGGTLDIAALAKTGEGFEIIGSPEGMERFGGIDLDQAVLAHVREAIGPAFEDLDRSDPSILPAMATLRNSCRDAKEALSSDSDAVVPVMLPGIHTEVRLTRGEFEDMIRPRLEETLLMLERVVRSAGCDVGDLARVLLVGGASRIPLVGEMIRAETGRPVAMDANPKHAVALGAARVGLEAESAGSAEIESTVREVSPDPARASEAAEPPPVTIERSKEPAEDPRAPAVKAADGPPGSQSGRRHWWWAAAVGIPIVAAAVVVAVVTLGGGGDGGDRGTSTTRGEASTTTAEALTTTGGAAVTEPAGSTVSLYAPPAGDEAAAAVETTLAARLDGSGVEVDYLRQSSVAGELAAALEQGDPPDLAILGLADALGFAGQGLLLSLEDLGMADGVREAYGDHLSGLVTVDGMHYAIPTGVSVKSLIWYHLPTFEAYGYHAPIDWQELTELSAAMVDDGLVPWCMGLESDSSSGWPATDWIEDILLRTTGPDTYDDWVSHRIPFTDPSVAGAVETLGEIVFGDGFLGAGGAEAAVERHWIDAAEGLLNGEEPSCVMYRQGTFLADYLPEGAFGEQLGAFAFPEIADGASGAVVGARFLVVLADRPEVRTAIEALTSPEVLCDLGSNPAVRTVSPHRGVSPDCYVDGLTRLAAEIFSDAGEGARYDASDLMPVEIGGNGGAFPTAMTAFFSGESIATVLEAVEAAWPAE